MNTVQQQLDELKRTLAAILDGIERLELQLDTPPRDDEHDESCGCEDCEEGRVAFGEWANAFDQRFGEASINRLKLHRECTDECDPDTALQIMADQQDPSSDPSANNHPAAWR